VQFIKTIFKDVLYVSKITGTQRKKVLILTSVICSQLAVLVDVFLIGLFAFLVADQKTNIEFVDEIGSYFESNRYLIIFIVALRFLFLFMQSYILRRIEFTVTKNLKEFILKRIFERRTYSISDAYFYTNDLSGHIGYFYSNFASFLNSCINILVFGVYLLISNFEVLAIFAAGLLLLFFPIKKLIKITRNYVDKTYFVARDSMSEIERVIENLFLIKILKKEDSELFKFSNTLSLLNSHMLNKHIFSILNGYLPSFLTLTILSIIIIFFGSIKLTLDFIGVTLKLFQSVSQVTTAFSNIINSHVHIKRFIELKFHENNPNENNFQIIENNKLEIQNVDFKYQNSNEYIFENISFEFEKGSHTIITGENGSGKSTLLGLVAGIFYPQSGTVKTFSNKYGYVSAQPYVFKDTLYNNIMYGNENVKVKESELIEVLKDFNTFKNESEYNLERLVSNKSLSSGQMQKIGFVRIMVSQPDIILLDESTSNLDKESKEIVFNKLKENNSTVINSTHDPENFDFADHHIQIQIHDEERVIKNIF
jgi:ATP-binding cassette subfamily B protein